MFLDVINQWINKIKIDKSLILFEISFLEFMNVNINIIFKENIILFIDN
jgi:hypothetical protein